MASAMVFRAGVRADDLAEILAAEGPFLTVYLGTDPSSGTPQRAETAWKSLRRDLEGEGAPQAALDAIEPLVGPAHQWGPTLAAVADASRLLHVEAGPETLPRDAGRWAPIPSVARIVEWRQKAPSHVVVLADRTGADLYAFRREAPDLHRRVKGAPDPHLHRGQPGGWSQRRFQQVAENLWEENAEQVAAEVTRLVGDVDARLVAAAGDVRAIGFLREHLPEEIDGLLTIIGGGRRPEASDNEIEREVSRVVEAAVDRETAVLIEALQRELAQEDRAVSGAAVTLQMLARAQVEVFLVAEDPDDERTAWFGPEPVHAATTERALRELGVEEPREARLVDVAVRAALGTGAAIRVIPAESGVDDGMGAILRWG
jgi:Bacterial archaeo-eukaryotic release factor family 2